MVNGGTAPFRTHARTSEPEGYCTDVTNPSSSSVVLGSDHPTTPRQKSAVPECSVTEKREHTGTGEGGGRRECLVRRGVVGRKCLTGQRLENTQISMKVKLRRRTRGQVWELVSGQERDGTISPGQRQERDGTISPGQRQERDGTISPGQRQERDGTISPGQRQERDGTISPGQRQERDGTISPGQRQERDGTISPGQRQERDGTISPGQRQERDGTISPGQRQERDGTISPGQRQSVLAALKKETECMRTRQLPHQSLHPPQFPALPRSSPLDTAFLTPPPDLPISPLRSHFHSTSNTTAQSISLNHCSSTHHPTPHPVHQPQLALPQPPVEESDEQIEKMLEDIMMGLNILPPMVLEKDCDRHHHLQSHDRPSACSCSHHPVHARHCGMHSAIGSASRCMCSQREGSDALSTETAFHSIISSHFATTTTTCTVTPDLYLDPQPLTPHCSTPHPSTPHHHSHPSTPHHHSHPHFSCNDYSSDWTECNRASYCSGVLQCSSENAKNHHELLVRFQNQNSQNQELQNRNSKSLVVGCGGSSSIIPVHSGPSPRPPHHHQSLPQSQASLPYTGEEDRDPGCWKGSSAQTGIPSTSKEYVCNLSSADCLSTNGKTAPSQVNGDTLLQVK
ncbi:arginine-glutamic acid dipeptide repeats protein-like isoform X2 [Coregonus clupeaformis]|uniref:arginine-glutamic acid dipeptide repeats protein-like isoform X2 n=1 Tax=Coregonus clupeaformis TaxID=59861 RepID=UPI001E1C3041|nr:arginine-glutamic acid dipeptide repeats protein-like isoform X2 [Coregonus clupeaformis]